MGVEGWKIFPFSVLVDINPKRGKLNNGVVPFVEMAAVSTNDSKIGYLKNRPFSGGGSKFANGDTLFARITPCAENGKIAFVDCLEDGVVGKGSTEFIVLSPNNFHITNQYVYLLARSNLVRKPAISRMEGTSGRQRVPKWVFDEIDIPLPPLPEQKKIAAILSSVDEAIQSTQAVIDQTQKVKKGLLQQLLTKGIGHTKFKKTEIGEIPESWEVLRVADVLEKVRNDVSVNPNHEYREIGIRSHGKGIFYKPPIMGKKLGNKRVFWIQPNCLVLNIVFAWERAVAQTTDAENGMIASHRFPMFRPMVGLIDLSFIKLFLLSSKGADALLLASPGGAGRNKTLGQKEFLRIKIPVPTMTEQLAIVKANSLLETELELLAQNQYSLGKIKNGLMSDLLTGRIRVKV
ncbi:MAG: restriction endonuclease subunit S [Magnetococcales bacterium]|nr:restriction endonuclease subunit S [Magnetococcales bacterium]